MTASNFTPTLWEIPEFLPTTDTLLDVSVSEAAELLSTTPEIIVAWYESTQNHAFKAGGRICAVRMRGSQGCEEGERLFKLLDFLRMTLRIRQHEEAVQSMLRGFVTIQSALREHVDKCEECQGAEIVESLRHLEEFGDGSNTPAPVPFSEVWQACRRLEAALDPDIQGVTVPPHCGATGEAGR